jgi:hypothetical protein
MQSFICFVFCNRAPLRNLKLSYSGVLISQNIEIGQDETIYCAYKNGSIGIFDFSKSKVTNIPFFIQKIQKLVDIFNGVISYRNPI